MSRALSQLVPPCRERCEEFLKRCFAAGHPVVITQTGRSLVEQHYLYESGRSRPGKIITKADAGHSWHNFGRAFDVAFLAPDGRITWMGPWEAIGSIGKDIGLVWGGDFHNFPDRPHFEYAAGVSLATMTPKDAVA